MKRLIALLTAFFLVASPALAGITQIAGSGTGGAIASANSGTGSLTTAAVSANVATGSLIVIAVGNRTGTTTGWSCTDSASTPNTYSVIGPFSSASTTTTAIFYAIAGASGNLVSGTTTVSCTVPGAAHTQVTVYAFAGVNASPLDKSGNNGAASASTSLSPVPSAATATLTCNSTGGAVAVGNLIGQNAPTNGGIGTGWTAGPLQQEGISAWQIFNTNAGVQWTNSVTQTSGAWEGVVGVFKAASCGTATVHTLLLTGVGD